AAPAVVFDPRTTQPSVRFYPRGLVDTENCVTLDIHDPDMSMARILEEIQAIYERFLITPDAQSGPGKVWKNADKHWAANNAEAVVQMYLRIGLWMAFPLCVVREE